MVGGSELSSLTAGAPGAARRARNPCRPIPVVIDTDPGVDDALALLLAAASPELDVLAVTTVGGNVRLHQATENAARILPIAWSPRVPPVIYRGTERLDAPCAVCHGIASGRGPVPKGRGDGRS